MNDFLRNKGNLLTHQNLLKGFEWLNKPEEFRFEIDKLIIHANSGTDFFRPINGIPKDNAPLFSCPISGDFSIQTHLNAELLSFGDAGSLILRYSSLRWAKICVEKSHDGEIGIVSVVTDETSDDANSELISSPSAFLRITKIEETVGMHYSLDGIKWRFVRKFRFEESDFYPLIIGIQAQSPYGAGTTISFDLLEISDQVERDFKSGK